MFRNGRVAFVSMVCTSLYKGQRIDTRLLGRCTSHLILSVNLNSKCARRLPLLRRYTRIKTRCVCWCVSMRVMQVYGLINRRSRGFSPIISCFAMLRTVLTRYLERLGKERGGFVPPKLIRGSCNWIRY